MDEHTFFVHVFNIKICYCVDKGKLIIKLVFNISRLDLEKGRQGKVTLPVYLNATRAQLLFTLDFETEGEGSGKDHSFYERGVAMISSDLG